MSLADVAEAGPSSVHTKHRCVLQTFLAKLDADERAAFDAIYQSAEWATKTFHKAVRDEYDFAPSYSTFQRHRDEGSCRFCDYGASE